MRDAALDEHQASEARFGRILSVLQDRVQDSYDWNVIWRPRGPFPLEPFRAPLGGPDGPSVPNRADAPGLAQWLFVILGLTLLSLAFGNFWQRVLSLTLLVGAMAWALVVQSQFRARCGRARGKRAVELENDVRALQQQHAEVQEKHRAAWEGDEEIRRRILAAPSDGNLEILCDVLEAELANEELPVPLVFDLSMTSAEAVQIELSLPELEEIPKERTRITKTGKLSRRALTQTERTNSYSDLCTGLTLRLVHETFRIVPTVDRIEVLGLAQRANPATGHQEEIVALHLALTRAQLNELNLDAVDPWSAFAGLGGAFACDRRGTVSPLPGISVADRT